MVYMKVLKKTDSHLQLLKEPTFLSKAVFIGFLVGVSGVILFGSESLLYKGLIGFGAIILSGFIVDNYEILDLNKETSDIKLTRLHLCQYFLGNIFSPLPYVTVKLSDVQDVRVDDQGPEDSDKAYRVVLVLKSGIHLGATEVFTTNSLSEHKKVAEVITNFLGIGNVVNADSDKDYDGDSSSTDGDDFEQITKAEIERLQREQNVTDVDEKMVSTKAEELKDLSTQEEKDS